MDDVKRQWRARTGALRGAVGRTVAGVSVLYLALTGCGSEEEAVQQPQPVVSGVLLDKTDGEPVSGVELELLVWPSPQSGASTSPTDAGGLISVDGAVTEPDGSFDLDALGSELSPHASANGQVGLEIRETGASGAGMRTTVRLSRDQETGVTSVEGLDGLKMTLADLGRTP